MADQEVTPPPKPVAGLTAPPPRFTSLVTWPQQPPRSRIVNADPAVAHARGGYRPGAACALPPFGARGRAFARQNDVRQTELLQFCRRIVAHLIEKRGFRLEDLVRFKYQLAKAVERKVTEYRQQALDRGYQQALFGSGAAVEASLGAALAFRFDGKSYAPSWPYTGRHQFRKSYVLPVGELKSSGEEFDCAQAIEIGRAHV